MVLMKVIKIPISQALPGMVVADDVFTKDNHLVIAKDTTLTDKIIARLEFYSLAEISVESVANPKDDVSAEKTTYFSKIKKSEAFRRFHLAYKNTISDFKETLDNTVNDNTELDTNKLLADASNILLTCDSSIELFNMLHCIRNYDDTTYVHSLNVSLICNVIGKWLHFSPADLEAITLAGLLHDLGKLMIPSTIITKPAKLTTDEFNTVKTHTIRGYNILNNKQNIDNRVKNAALMHHERCDGSGYPYGLHNNQIDPFAKLVAIADVYDAMTCARVYRGPLCPFDVISIFESEGFTKYDPQYIMKFLEGIAQTYIHNTVKLSNGMTGEIVLINKTELSRPVILVGDKFIDLSKQRDIQIVALQ
jgi:putative nucleotidyltransferase with HDIG domain